MSCCNEICIEDLDFTCGDHKSEFKTLEINTNTKEITINGELCGYVSKDYDGGNVIDYKDLNGGDCVIYLNSNIK